MPLKSLRRTLRNTNLEIAANRLTSIIPVGKTTKYMTVRYHYGRGNMIRLPFMRLKRPKIVMASSKPPNMDIAATVTITTGKKKELRFLCVPKGTLFGQHK